MTKTALTDTERIDRLEEIVATLANAVGHVSMNHSATRRGRIVELLMEQSEENV